MSPKGTTGINRLIRLARSTLVVTCLVGAGAWVAPVSTARAEVPAIGKVAMVDMQRVLNETNAGKRARKELEASSKAKQSKLEKKRAKIESDAAKLKSLSGAQLAAAQEKIQQESMELQSMLFTLEQELGEMHNKMLEKMYRNAQDIVAAIAKERGLDLVLVRDDMTVIYTKDSLDITDEVVQKYNKAHK